MSELSPLNGKPDSLTQIVYDAIREAIVNKTLPPGGRVSEASLARQLAVSKTPVREALLRLQSVGLVEADGNRGARVVQPSESAIMCAYEVRAVLEAAAARFAAERAAPTEGLHLVELAQKSLSCAEVGDREGFLQWDGVFHRAIAEAAGNLQLRELVENALTLTSALRQRDIPENGAYSVKCGKHHTRIASAIKRGLGEQAAEAAQVHVLDVRDHLLDVLHPDSGVLRAQVAVSQGGDGGRRLTVS